MSGLNGDRKRLASQRLEVPGWEDTQGRPTLSEEKGKRDGGRSLKWGDQDGGSIWKINLNFKRKLYLKKKFVRYKRARA